MPSCGWHADRVHRATAARWLTAARAQLLEATRAAMSRRPQFDASQFEVTLRSQLG